MQVSQQALEEQLAAIQQQLQQLQQQVCIGTALGRSSPVLRSLAGTDVCASSAPQDSMACVTAHAAQQGAAGGCASAVQFSNSGSRGSSCHSRCSSQSSQRAAAVAGTVLGQRNHGPVCNRHATTSIHADERSNHAGYLDCATRLLGRSQSTACLSSTPYFSDALSSSGSSSRCSACSTRHPCLSAAAEAACTAVQTQQWHWRNRWQRSCQVSLTRCCRVRWPA
ncbi:hypothetical protein COO60DRAFT_408627 [Scenedesmus sp. NREL 46B-D3]|nr:hypothetical protein COO60DRAFT_408627 [Scenedesmus sp. NREL 46B-D3]